MDATQNRRAWMGLLARARPELLAALTPDDAPEVALQREPEVDAVMVRGRAGAAGAPFNLGETTDTRCTLRIAGGVIGCAHVQGRDKARTRRAALTAR